MRKNLMLGLSVASLLLAGATLRTFAADPITISGEGKCAKCGLHEADKCQNVIQTKEDGKTVNYYLVQNKVAKDFHKNVCQDTKKVKATGTVKVVDGKNQFTATEIKTVE
jgi:hypothetical protein